MISLIVWDIKQKATNEQNKLIDTDKARARARLWKGEGVEGPARTLGTWGPQLQAWPVTPVSALGSEIRVLCIRF